MSVNRVPNLFQIQILHKIMNPVVKIFAKVTKIIVKYEIAASFDFLTLFSAKAMLKFTIIFCNHVTYD